MAWAIYIGVAVVIIVVFGVIMYYLGKNKGK